MPQFDVFKNKDTKSKSAYPFLVDVQSDLLSRLRTRVVVPLAKLVAIQKKPIKDLTPVVEIDGAKYLLLVPQLAGVAISDLGQPIGNVGTARQEIIAAIDFLVTGV